MRIVRSSFILLLVNVITIKSQEPVPPASDPDSLSSLVSFNFMNCMDFARHMTSTAEKFGIISSTAAQAEAAVRRRRIDQQFVDAIIPKGLVDRMFVGLDHHHHHHHHDVRQSAAGLLQTFQMLFRQLLNIGDSNVAACNARPKLTACENVDNNLNRYLPGWWFDLKVTDNANYLASQFVAGSRYHALAESGMKAYKCFCQC